MLRVFLVSFIFALLSPSLSAPSLAQVPGGAFSHPSFDCTKVSAPLPVTICNNEAAAHGDWELSSAFWALYFAMEDASRLTFVRAQDDWFRSLVQSCDLTNLAQGSGARPTDAQSSCVAAQYRNRAAEYRARLSDDALAEAYLSPERHKQIQDSLISLGLLTGRAEGLFGPQTRRAIKQFQSLHNFSPTGFLSSGQQRMLIGEDDATPVPKVAASPPLPTSQTQAGTEQESNKLIPSEKPAKKESASREILAGASSVESQGSTSQKVAAREGVPRKVPDDQAAIAEKALCESVGSDESAAACSRLIASGIGEGAELARLVFNRAKSNEALNRDGLALADYNAAFLLAPDLTAALAGRTRMENKVRVQQGPSASIPKPNEERASSFDEDGPSSGFSSTNSYFLIFIGLLSACVLLVVIRARNVKSSWINSAYDLLQTSQIRRRLGAAASVSIVAVACVHLWFGSAQSTTSVAQIAQHIPLTSQAYVVVPHFGTALQAAKRLLSEAANSIDVDRLARATRGSVRDIKLNLARFQSVVPMSIPDGDYIAANGCLDFAETPDRIAMGLTSTTSAAAFVGGVSDTLPIVAIGPVDRSRLSVFLANAASRFMLDLSTNDAVRGDPINLSLEQWRGKDLRLCHVKNGIIGLQAGSFLEVSPTRQHAIVTIDPTSSVAEDASFSVLCSYEVSGQKRTCRCEVWERPSDGTPPIHLGDCDSIGKSFGEHASSQRTRTKAINEGAVLPGPITFDIPLIGPIVASDDILVRWSDDILVVGQAKALQNSLAGTASASSASVVRDDSFVNLFRHVSVRATGFFGLARPDWYPSSTWFNRLVSVPMSFRGAFEDKLVELHASLNFEPLDAAILQDMSRSYSGAEGEVPINSSMGSASLRIGDDKVSQYINFADQFILNRIIQGLSSLDTEDPVTNVKVDFIRYTLRKLGLRDGASSSRDDSFANQPHQIIVLDDPPGAWAPSIAVAVKFQSLDAAYTFLCAEPSRLRQTIDVRILQNAARAAKKETRGRIPDDLEDYRSLLHATMAASLEDGSWDRYRSRYDIDPFYITINNNSDSASLDNRQCEPTLSDEPIDGKVRKIYYLSPSLDKNMKRFYYRFDSLSEAAEERARKLDPAITDLVGTLQELPGALKACRAAKRTLADSLTEARKETGPISPLLKSLELKLRSELDAGGVEVTRSDWSTAEDVQNELANTSLLDSIERRIAEIRDTHLALRDSLAAKRIQRAIAASEGERISHDLSSGKQRIVAYLDERRRLLFIANDIGTLKRAAEQAEPSNQRGVLFDKTTDERIRFYASGDNAVQSILDVMPVEQAADLPLLWRAAKLGGSVLPFEAANAGVSGQTSGIVVSLVVALPKRGLK